jgi:squalene-hopene/tetraprenyl-beta-curcumene cyclase
MLTEPLEINSGTVSMSGLERAIAGAQAALLAKQAPDGYWVGELQGDSILESEFILLKFILGQENEPDLVKIATYLRRLQQPDGGWNLFPGGAADLSGTVKAYFALKLMGDDPNAPHMLRARDLCRAKGGAEKCNSFTKFYFAALGQVSYDACPSIPPEIVFLPKWSYFNLYHVSAWTRTMILPLAIVTTLRPVRNLPPHRGIAELYLDAAAANRVADPRRGMPASWRELFLHFDKLLKMYERKPVPQLRRRAIKAAEQWILKRLDGSEGLGAIFPPMVYVLIVFRALGYPDDHPRVVTAQKHLRELFIEEGDAIRIQPCHSPVWDTGFALHSLADIGATREAAEPIRKAVDWLLKKECRVAGDWLVNIPRSNAEQKAAAHEPTGWFFEFSNPYYPDVDDTAMVVMTLHRVGGQVAGAAVGRGLNWLLAMQNDDAGWAAFDRTRSRPILEHVPFADHNAMQDPSCPDITARVLECLGHCGLTKTHPAVCRAITFIRQTQDKDGSWWGRWGINYVYGTWQVLTGLRAVGLSMDEPFIQKAADWLRSVQKPDGSFGETADSYEDATLKGTGPTTASQTAWGTMGLLAAAGPNDPAVQSGIQWLIANQAADGAWNEFFYTGTGFPRVFYLKYHLYRLYFPLMALARFRRLIERDGGNS